MKLYIYQHKLEEYEFYFIDIFLVCASSTFCGGYIIQDGRKQSIPTFNIMSEPSILSPVEAIKKLKDFKPKVIELMQKNSIKLQRFNTNNESHYYETFFTDYEMTEEALQKLTNELNEVLMQQTMLEKTCENNKKNIRR